MNTLKGKSVQLRMRTKSWKEYVKARTWSAGSEKDVEREEKKLTISMPRNDFRHTAHIGIKGDSFGETSIFEKAENLGPKEKETVEKAISTKPKEKSVKSKKKMKSPILENSKTLAEADMARPYIIRRRDSSSSDDDDYHPKLDTSDFMDDVLAVMNKRNDVIMEEDEDEDEDGETFNESSHSQISSKYDRSTSEEEDEEEVTSNNNDSDSESEPEENEEYEYDSDKDIENNYDHHNDNNINHGDNNSDTISVEETPKIMVRRRSRHSRRATNSSETQDKGPVPEMEKLSVTFDENRRQQKIDEILNRFQNKYKTQSEPETKTSTINDNDSNCSSSEEENFEYSAAKRSIVEKIRDNDVQIVGYSTNARGSVQSNDREVLL